MVSMERELNKLFNDTNYNKENVIIREIWSIKLELQNFFWGVYNELELEVCILYYFVLYDSVLTLKMSKMALNPFCDKTLHGYSI